MMNMPAIIATIIMLIGFTVVLIVPIIKLKRLDEETNGYKKVMGKVVDYIKKGYTSSNESRKVYYYPVVLYEVDNKEYKVTSQVGYSEGKLFMPKRLIVLYNPENPNNAVITNEKKLYLIILIGFTITILIMIYFLINNLILGNENNNAVYYYRVTCNIEGMKYDEVVYKRAKSSKEALKLVKEQYKNWNGNCTFKETVSATK